MPTCPTLTCCQSAHAHVPNPDLLPSARARVPNPDLLPSACARARARAQP